MIEKDSVRYNEIIFNIIRRGKIVLSHKIPMVSLFDPFKTSQQNLLTDSKNDDKNTKKYVWASISNIELRQ